MMADARKAWVIAGSGFIAAVAIAIGLVVVASWLVDFGDLDVAPPTNAQGG